MKYLKPLFFLIVGVLLLALLGSLSACDFAVTRYGPNLTEEATVADLAYIPSGHGSGVGVGFTTGGNMAVTSTSVDIPERYAVVFHCPHGKFVVEGGQYRGLWMRLREGQAVTVHYRHVQECRKVDGVIQEDTCRTVDLDFLDATARGVE